MYCAKSDELLVAPSMKKNRGKAQLVFTSPPYPLIAKKKYGNKQGEEYIKFIANFAPLLRNMLTPNGSIVVEIGNAWEPGEPAMSTVVLRALLAFLERGGLHLCQEFIWYNPARLPSPVQWVNIERIRVKDAFTRLWWMSPTTRPKADNRKVLREYSPSMKQLLKSQKYNAGRRPSHHIIGKTSFNTSNGGSIPPNVGGAEDQPTITSLLKSSNTRSSEQYQLFARANDLPVHPARMPPDLAEFFIKFLTDEGDLVLDPFAGSNTTGAVAEQLNRRWLSVEAQWEYAATSVSRFPHDDIRARSKAIEMMEDRAHSDAVKRKRGTT